MIKVNGASILFNNLGKLLLIVIILYNINIRCLQTHNDFYLMFIALKCLSSSILNCIEYKWIYRYTEVYSQSSIYYSKVPNKCPTTY